jgi:hypothetical protein
VTVIFMASCRERHNQAQRGLARRVQHSDPAGNPQQAKRESQSLSRKTPHPVTPGNKENTHVP